MSKEVTCKPCVCTRFIMACVCSRACLLKKENLFPPRGHGQPNKGLIYIWMLKDQAHRAVRLQSHDSFFFFLQMLRSRDVPKRTECFALCSERPPFTNK